MVRQYIDATADLSVKIPVHRVSESSEDNQEQEYITTEGLEELHDAHESWKTRLKISRDYNMLQALESAAFAKCNLARTTPEAPHSNQEFNSETSPEAVYIRIHGELLFNTNRRPASLRPEPYWSFVLYFVKGELKDIKRYSGSTAGWTI
ncbi:hypothetical protein BDZ94DRAFT_1371433 [Collybia nuda]|uniref:Uncharacterized protein n=1 Tax=Collybia nuda TaxID=64659 RepID=A0A9P5XT66_9AGAR|nr:hypothetical protein BDZ94DRAFT_1371433 [Collybia nuda]